MRARPAAALLGVLLLVPVASPAQDIKGQKPVLILDGAFQFTPRSWGSYIVHNKTADEYYAFTMAVLNDETRKGRTGTWLEIDVDTGKERVVTRMLAEKTPSGPGELMAGAVWIEGMKPFSIPEKYLSGDEKEVGQFNVARGKSRVEPRTFTHDGRQVRGYYAEFTDDKGGVTRALVSAEVAPMGVVWVDAPDTEMFLSDWGSGAETRVKGRPMSMWLWVMDLVARGLSGDEVVIPERKLAAPVIAGVWEERDGPCAGSQWTVDAAGAAGRGARSAARCAGSAGEEVVRTAVWKTPRVVAGDLDGTGRKGVATIMFASDTQAVLAVKDPAGTPSAFSVLRKR